MIQNRIYSTTNGADRGAARLSRRRRAENRREEPENPGDLDRPGSRRIASLSAVRQRGALTSAGDHLLLPPRAMASRRGATCVQICHKGAKGPIRPLAEPRNHAVFLRQDEPGRGLCGRFGHCPDDSGHPAPVTAAEGSREGDRSPKAPILEQSQPRKSGHIRAAGSR